MSKILLVEDEALIAMSESEMLKKHGYEVITASNGEKAIEAVDSDPGISLILMDIDLGKGIAGTEAAERILTKYDLPIAFLSSHTEPEVVEKTEGITSYGYIVKNSGETVLLASIKMAFRLYEAHMELKRQKENLNTALVKYEQTAEELAEKNEELDRYFSSSLDLLCIANTSGEFIRLNPEWEKVFEYSVVELEGWSILDFVHPEDGESTRKMIAKLDAGENVTSFENRFRGRDGSYRWIEWRSKPIGSEIYAAARDVTERKRAEHEMTAREENLRITLSSIGDAVISTDIEGNIVRMNPVAETLCGWDTGEARGKSLKEVFHIVHADTGDRVDNPVAKVLETGNTIGLANHTMLISSEGTEYQIADSAAPIRDDNGIVLGVVLVFRDVTEEYRVAQALSESEREMARAQAIAQLGSWRFDLDSGLVTGSDQARMIYGVGDGELTIEYVQSLPLPEYRAMLNSALKALVEHGAPYDVEFRIRRPSDDTVRCIHSIAEYDSQHHWIVGTLQDITERRQMEEALREGNKTAHEFFSESAAGAFFMMLDEPIEWNDSGDKEQVLDYVFDHQRITEVNKAMLNQYLAREEDFLWKTPNQLFAHDVEHGRSLWRKMFDQGFLNIDSDERRFDGSQLWIIGSYRCMFDEQGRITGHFGTQHDITDQKSAERALREKESQLTEAQKLAQVGSWEYDIASNTIVGSEEGFRIYGMKPPATGLLPIKEIEACIPDSRRVHQALVDLIEKGSPYDLEFEIHPADESKPKTIISKAKLTKDSEGNPVKVHGVIQDITERKRADEKIQRQLAEKEILLTEVHHRTKNNIAQVESLLSIQAGSTDSAEVTSALNEAISRVGSIRRLYEKLLIGTGYEEISMKDYLESLIDSLVEVFNQCPSVTIEKKIIDFALSSKKAIPVGIILNELLTNVFKYAFTGRDSGRVVVELNKTETRAALTVSDNGIGLADAGAANTSPGFGLAIVKMLVEQLEGTFSLETKNGTRSVLEFEI